MTVGTTINIATLLTDGVATEFPFYFTVFAQSDLTVLLRDLDGVVVKTYAQNEFSVSGLGGNAGTVTISPAPADNRELIILREVPFEQPTDIVNQGGFFPEVVERQLDLIVMQTQQLNEKLGRALVAPVGDPAYNLIDLAEEIAGPAQDAAAEAQGYAAALLTYTFGYIGIGTSVPPIDVANGEGYVYVIDGRVYGALNDGGVADVQFELLTAALAAAGGPGAGTVTSVAGSGGSTGLSFTGGPITSAGTLTLGGTLAVAHGGTGASTAAGARGTLGAAKSGANADITSLRQSTAVEETGTASENSLGFRGFPLSEQTQGNTITLALTDFGKMVHNTGGGWVIPANASVAFPVGAWAYLYNDSASPQTISINSDTLRREGTATTGTRTLAQRGTATVVKIKPTEWLIISGSIT
jgi:hypothetical protein